MNKMWRVYIMMTVMMVLSACSTMSDWFTKETDESPPEELVEFLPEFEPEIIWSVDTGGGTGDNKYSDLAAWIQGDMIVVVDYEGEVSSHHTQTGKRLWQTDLDQPVVAGVGGGDGLILVGTEEGTLFALNEEDGKVRWQKTLTSEILAPAKAGQGIVVVRTADGRMSGLSVAEGADIWVYQRNVPLLSLRGDSEPVIVGDTVIAGCAGGKLVALSLLDGKVIWEKSVAMPRGRTELDRVVDIDSVPVVVADRVYAVAYHGEIAVLDFISGNTLWSRAMSSRSGLDVASGDAVYVSDDLGNIWALQDETGHALWRQTKLLRRQVSAPTVVGNYIIVGDFEGYAHWISREDGRFVARKKVTDHAINSKPVVKDGQVFVNAIDGTLTAFRM